jgi:hypothetical protein
MIDWLAVKTSGAQRVSIDDLVVNTVEWEQRDIIAVGK